jgi:hypothetical protein
MYVILRHCEGNEIKKYWRRAHVRAMKNIDVWSKNIKGRDQFRREAQVTQYTKMDFRKIGYEDINWTTLYSVQDMYGAETSYEDKQVTCSSHHTKLTPVRLISGLLVTLLQEYGVNHSQRYFPGFRPVGRPYYIASWPVSVDVCPIHILNGL